LLLYSKNNNTKEVNHLLDISSNDLRPEINVRDENGKIWLKILNRRKQPITLRMHEWEL